MERPVSPLIEVLHWASLAAAAAFSFRMFRDLTELGRRLAPAPVSAIMATHIHRHQIIASVFALWTAAFLSHLVANAGYGPIFWVVTALSVGFCLAGYAGLRNSNRTQAGDSQSPADKERV